MGLGGKGFRIREKTVGKRCHWVLGRVRWSGFGSAGRVEGWDCLIGGDVGGVRFRNAVWGP